MPTVHVPDDLLILWVTLQVVDHVVVQLDDGAQCRVLRATPDKLVPQEAGTLFSDEEMWQCPYYPGLRVKASSAPVLRFARWLRGTWKGRYEATVLAVEPGEVTVDWIAAGKFAADNTTPPPEVKVSRTYTTIDVKWQDGTESMGMPSRALVPVSHLGEHDFWPEEFVYERLDPTFDSSAAGNPASEGTRRVGLIRSVNAEERTAQLLWLPRDAQGRLVLPRPGEGAAQREGYETVSVYELSEHHDYNYRIGDVVLRLYGPHAAGEPAVAGTGVDPMRDTVMVAVGETVSTLSWVGEISGLLDGMIEVAWGDGLTSKVGPEEVYVVSREDEEDPGSAYDDAGYDDEMAAGGSDGSVGSWETVDSDALGEMDEREQLRMRWEQQREHEHEHEWLSQHARASAGSPDRPEMEIYTAGSPDAAEMERLAAILEHSAPSPTPGAALSSSPDTLPASTAQPAGALGDAATLPEDLRQEAAGAALSTPAMREPQTQAAAPARILETLQAGISAAGAHLLGGSQERPEGGRLPRRAAAQSGAGSPLGQGVQPAGLGELMSPSKANIGRDARRILEQSLVEPSEAWTGQGTEGSRVLGGAEAASTAVEGAAAGTAGHADVHDAGRMSRESSSQEQGLQAAPAEEGDSAEHLAQTVPSTVETSGE
eukprot:gene15252-18039_t